MSHLLWACFGLLLAFAPANVFPASEPSPPTRSITYKTVGQRALQLHVFEPAPPLANATRPAVVFFHGGGWKQGSARAFFPQCADLARRGMVAISAEYRVASRENTDPRACVQDAKSALRWVRAHATELGIDPRRIAAGGGSAGGHIAAASALLDGFNDAGDDAAIDCRPNALILFNPVFDNGPDGYGFDRVSGYWREFSPLHNIRAGAPPTIVFLGTDDRIIPVATAIEYQRRMQQAGARCDLHLYSGQPHGFFHPGNSGYYTETMAAAEAFLVSLGYLVPVAQFQAPPSAQASPGFPGLERQGECRVKAPASRRKQMGPWFGAWGLVLNRTRPQTTAPSVWPDPLARPQTRQLRHGAR